jgi:hypothetical protein
MPAKGRSLPSAGVDAVAKTTPAAGKSLDSGNSDRETEVTVVRESPVERKSKQKRSKVLVKEDVIELSDSDSEFFVVSKKRNVSRKILDDDEDNHETFGEFANKKKRNK